MWNKRSIPFVNGDDWTRRGPDRIRNVAFPRDPTPDILTFHTSLMSTYKLSFKVDPGIRLWVDLEGNATLVLFRVTPTLARSVKIWNAYSDKNVRRIEPDRGLFAPSRGSKKSIFASFWKSAIGTNDPEDTMGPHESVCMIPKMRTAPLYSESRVSGIREQQGYMYLFHAEHTVS